jgi:hypothetical protein
MWRCVLVLCCVCTHHSAVRCITGCGEWRLWRRLRARVQTLIGGSVYVPRVTCLALCFDWRRDRRERRRAHALTHPFSPRTKRKRKRTARHSSSLQQQPQQADGAEQPQQMPRRAPPALVPSPRPSAPQDASFTFKPAEEKQSNEHTALLSGARVRTPQLSAVTTSSAFSSSTSSSLATVSTSASISTSASASAPASAAAFAPAPALFVATAANAAIVTPRRVAVSPAATALPRLTLITAEAAPAAPLLVTPHLSHDTHSVSVANAERPELQADADYSDGGSSTAGTSSDEESSGAAAAAPHLNVRKFVQIFVFEAIVNAVLVVQACALVLEVYIYRSHFYVKLNAMSL